MAPRRALRAEGGHALRILGSPARRRSNLAVDPRDVLIDLCVVCDRACARGGWAQANAMRSPQEKNTRLENMTWRIWNLARKKKEVRLFALGSFLLSLRAACFVSDAVREDVCPSVFDNSIHTLGSGKRSSGFD